MISNTEYFIECITQKRIEWGVNFYESEYRDVVKLLPRCVSSEVTNKSLVVTAVKNMNPNGTEIVRINNVCEELARKLLVGVSV